MEFRPTEGEFGDGNVVLDGFSRMGDIQANDKVVFPMTFEGCLASLPSCLVLI